MLVLALTACAPWNAVIQRAIAQTQTAAANTEQFETPPPVELTPTEPGEATSPPVDENGNPITDQGEATRPPVSGPAHPNPDQEEATNPPVDENGNPITNQMGTPITDMTAEQDMLGETPTLLPDNLEMIPPKTAAPASKDSGSGLLIVAILFLVGVFVQLESKGGKKHP